MIDDEIGFLVSAPRTIHAITRSTPERGTALRISHREVRIAKLQFATMDPAQLRLSPVA